MTVAAFINSHRTNRVQRALDELADVDHDRERNRRASKPRHRSAAYKATQRRLESEGRYEWADASSGAYRAIQAAS